MFQESRKVKIYFTVKAEDKKNFVFRDFSVVEYFGHIMSNFVSFSPPFFTKMAVKIPKINFWKMAKFKFFVLIFRINPIR